MKLSFSITAVIALMIVSGAPSWGQSDDNNQIGGDLGAEAEAELQRQPPEDQIGARNGEGGQPNNGRRASNAQLRNRQWSPDLMNEHPWFTDRQVQQTLGLDDDQVGRLRDSYGRSFRRYDQQVNNLDPGLSDQQRTARLRELRSGFVKDFNREAGDTVDEQQRARFNQLNFQRQGVNAFSDPSVQERFNFSDAQTRQLQRLQEQYNRRMNRLSRANASAEEQRREFGELQQTTTDSLNGIFNDQQRTAFEQMTGDRFDFSANNLFGRGDSSATPGTGIGTPSNPIPGSGIGTPGGATPGSGIGQPGSATPGTGIGQPESGKN